MSYEPRLLIFSGAGLDAESGVPTFRDADGLWEGNDINEVCSINTFPKNYDKVHEFYNQRRMDLSSVIPNKAHEFISEMQQTYGAHRVINITANVSDLLERAGVQNVMHIHGNLTKIIKNYRTNDSEVIDIGYTNYDYRSDKNPDGSYKLSCKPDVIFFGEMAPRYEDMMYILMNIRPQDTFIMVGSTLEVNPVHYYASSSEFVSAVINPDIKEDGTRNLDIASSMVDFSVKKKASEGFEDLRAMIQQRME